ncbi:hypothetical protein JTB14_000516 [Gonioctena quinquepunctata]|nr:hypothetical protein JTB14_000516 [Gonioctena quinquepunctata]
MSKFYDITQGSLLDDLNYMKQVQYTKDRLDREFSGDYNPNSRKTERGSFSLHPGKLDDSDSSSSEGNSSSSRSTVNIDLDNLEVNKLKIKNERKKLHEKLTRTNRREDIDIDVGIGDACSLTPTNTFKGRNRVKNKSLHAISERTINASTCASQKSIMSESIFEKKFKIFVEKSLHTISDIRNLLEKGIDPPDGDEDISRRQLRVKEFSNRFSRNYLYPIVRQLDDLKNWKPSNPNRNQKLLSAYQIILNGLQAYQNHLPTSIGDCSSDKFKLLLKRLLELCDIHNNFIVASEGNSYGDFLNSFRLNAELTLQKIEDHFTAISTESMLKSATTKLSLPHYRNEQTINKKNKPKNNIEERLSMYSTTCSFRKDAFWRRAVENLAKKKFNVKSRYKTALFKHRPPMGKPGTQMLAVPSKCRLFSKKASMVFRKTPHTSPMIEDDITTLIEMEGNAEDDVEKTDENKNEVILLLILTFKELKFGNSCEVNNWPKQIV